MTVIAMRSMVFFIAFTTQLQISYCHVERFVISVHLSKCLQFQEIANAKDPYFSDVQCIKEYLDRSKLLMDVLHWSTATVICNLRSSVIVSEKFKPGGISLCRSKILRINAYSQLLLLQFS